MGSSPSAPTSDPRMGEAAVMSAETGRAMMDWMKGQAEITNGWAAADRTRFKTVFEPLQNQFIADAKAFDSPGRKAAKAAEAAGGVSLAARLAQGQQDRNLMRMGVNPASGAAIAARSRAGTDTALARAGAVNLSNRQVEAEADAKIASAINLGSGMAVNPGTSMGLSNQAGGAGFEGAMRGYGQAGSLWNQDYQNRMSTWQANQGAQGSLWGGLGALAGAFGPQMLTMMSSKEAKTDKTPIEDGAALAAVRKMPVEEWTYKPGAGDGGRHIGPYAEDFAKATGQGDGKTIDVVSMLGVTLGAVRDLDRKVAGLGAPRMKKAAA